MAEYDGEKTVDATPHRREQARQQGHVAKSQELCAAVILMAGLLAIWLLGGRLAEHLGRYCREQLGEPVLSTDHAMAVAQWSRVAMGLAQYLLPLLGVVLGAALVVHLAQTGLLLLPQRVAPDPSRLDPMQGLQRIFSGGNAARLALGLLKMAIIVAVAAACIYVERGAILDLAAADVPRIAASISRILMVTSMKMAAAMLGLAVLDYAYQWWKHQQQLRMTPQELREELRNVEGNPQVIGRRRQMQRELARGRPLEALGQADLLLSSPSGVVVALRYRPETMSAPVVVAKATGATAGRMQLAARHSGLPEAVAATLAESLHRRVEIHRAIPRDHYAAVAELLARSRGAANCFPPATTA